MTISNFSFHGSAADQQIGQFLVTDQGHAYSIHSSGQFSSIVLLQTLLVFLALLSLPGNIAIFATLFKNSFNDRPFNLLILMDQLINTVQRYQMSAFSQYYFITQGSGLRTVSQDLITGT